MLYHRTMLWTYKNRPVTAENLGGIQHVLFGNTTFRVLSYRRTDTFIFIIYGI